MMRFQASGLWARCWPLLTFPVLVFGLQACTLDRTGGLGCPKEGAISCGVHTVSYAFDNKENNYMFEGQCTLIEKKGQSQFTDPTIQFKVAGEYERQSLQFRESVLVEHDTFPLSEMTQTEWALEGFSPLDPWLYPSIPVGIQNAVGDPNEFAKGLCVETIPDEYRRIPFSRNVIVHMLSLQQLIAMRLEAAAGETVDVSEPPPPPCPPHYLSSPPELVMPKDNLVYKADVQGVTVELRSKCGAEHVEYQESIYGLDFERYQSGQGWREYRTFQIPMTPYVHGGSQGFDTLPIKGNGLWRVKVIQYTTIKGSGQYSDWSDWVQFRIGDAKLLISELENLSDLIQVINADNAYREPGPSRQEAFKRIQLRSETSEAIRSREETH